MEHLGHSWPWYALALLGVYRLTATGLDALVRHVVRTASQTRAEHHHATVATIAPPWCGTLTPDRPWHGAPPEAAVPPPPRPQAGHCCEETR
ncbi:putative hypothetical protein [Streptomyces sp. NBRC 110611]|uniref:hypothetical protein n=1 Tax=Streptomyces sp. NBRC 110611 TaxID=1621259 RepID=UPI000858BB27|nr:hypothetical protein [Streptomyces sp. NBRC 110611]GAU70421.1 putative hypothetical protein [Streptomyces sp. NBRC 110611]